MDETSIQETQVTHWDQQAKIAVANMRRKRLHAEFVPDRAAAREKILNLIPPGASVGRGDSMTLEQLEVLEALKQSGDHEVFDPFERNEDGSLKIVGDARLELHRKCASADVFLSGANAITLDGRVVATDSTGNRVAAMIFGPKKIIIVAGVNKLVRDMDAAMERIHSIAAPMDLYHHAKYHKRPAWLELPCIKAGKCPDCAHVERGCNFTIVIEGNREGGRHNIILVGESLGF